jgi:hypothetical protein
MLPTKPGRAAEKRTGERVGFGKKREEMTYLRFRQSFQRVLAKDCASLMPPTLPPARRMFIASSFHPSFQSRKMYEIKEKGIKNFFWRGISSNLLRLLLSQTMRNSRNRVREPLCLNIFAMGTVADMSFRGDSSSR